MRRRKFALVSGASAFSLGLGPRAMAQSAADPNLLKTTLTPFGAERAGNAAGTIPAWTGGYAPGMPGWKGADQLPDFIDNDKPLFTINSSNYTQYQDKLSAGVIDLIQNSGYSLQIYPSQRPHAMQQYIYDNIALNATRATLEPAGGRFGFDNGYGGIPFPIPNTSDPLVAGPQIMWNHVTRWTGFCQSQYIENWTIVDGNPVLASGSMTYYKNPYYDPNGSLETYSGVLQKILDLLKVPANLNGQVDMEWSYSNSYKNPNQIWELLTGQARVRKAPELQYDTPSSLSSGLVGYDEYFGYYPPAEEYDWRYITKKEMFIPYNNNKTNFVTSDAMLGPKFMNPDLVRWELHRVWVVEGTLHPGYRNVLARRRFYMDEDMWMVVLNDNYDANNALFHSSILLSQIVPDVLGNMYQRAAYHNMQTGNWTAAGNFNSQIPFKFDVLPDSSFDPQVMAAQSAY
jgi:hypothetical protein